ncbi:tryptophan dimethylallyltransferase family protein [Streptomyces sp. NPDC056716]|uniref:tryptophan dimethylallyltransferase family protein n=1 Tax=unclassified Streptomyces TaxID=2593676 RepID=UPI0036AABB35
MDAAGIDRTAYRPDTGVIAEMIGSPMRFDTPRYRPTQTYAEVAADRVRRTWRSLGLTGESEASTLALLRELTEPWGGRPVGVPPERACWVAIDGSPFEPSVVWAGDRAGVRAGVRLSIEPPGEGTALSRMRDAMDVTRRLAGRPGVSVDRLLAVEDLFRDDDPQGYFSFAHAVALRPGAAPEFKVFLNPAVAGREQAADRTAKALRTLGLGTPWQALADHLGEFGPGHEPVAIALDLTGGPDFRAQLYLAHSGVSAAEIDAKAAVARDHIPGLFTRALEQINGPHGTAAWSRKPPVTTFTLDTRHDLPSATVYVPLIPVHDHDAAARTRVSAFLRAEGSPAADAYTKLLDDLADRPLTESRTQNFISYRGGDDPRFSVYLAPGLYRAAH